MSTSRIWKNIYVFILLNCFIAHTYAKIDVDKYTINLTFRSMTEERIEGFTKIEFTFLDDSSIVRLDLDRLKVSEVLYENKKLIFQQDSLGFIFLMPNGVAQKQKKASVTITYSGQPGKPSWFGGVYFSKDYIYNLGVAIDRIPHTYGKVWFPCKDNFTDKALFEYFFTVPDNKVAVCNGTLVKTESQKEGLKTYHWLLKNPIPTYLASFAVSNYEEWKDTYKSPVTHANIPISIYVNKGKRKEAEKSFANLKKTMAFFEEKFGYYRWERIGYVAVPMTGGAMEHATNIAYPANFIDASNKHDHLWAHELAHSWFGNLVTCASSSEMWLNEGFARYSEALYSEAVAGIEEARNYTRKIQQDAIFKSNKRDGYLAITPVDEKHTYSSTVYDKGGSVVHTLRNYLGDDIFFKGIKKYMNQYAFQNASTEQLMACFDVPERLSLEDFTQGWLKSPGHILITVDSLRAYSHHLPGRWMVNLALRQNLIQKPNPISKLKIEVLFLGQNYEQYLDTVIFSGEVASVHSQLRFVPKAVIVDPYEKVCDASIDRLIQLDKKQVIEFPHCTLEVLTEDKRSVIQVGFRSGTPREPYGPGGQGYMAMNYWNFSGLLEQETIVKASFSLTLKTFFSPVIIEQHTLNPNDRTPIALFFRPNVRSPWQKIADLPEYDAIDLSKTYEITIPKVQVGDYTFGFIAE